MFTLKLIYRVDNELLNENPNLPAKIEKYFYLGDTFQLEYPQNSNPNDPEQPFIEVWSESQSGCKHYIYADNEAYIINDQGQTVKILARGY